MATPEDVRDKLRSIFRRRGGSGERTRLFEDFEAKVREQILREVDLPPSELPVAAAMSHGGPSFLITTHKIIWFGAGISGSVLLSQIDKVRPHVKDFGANKSNMTRLEIKIRGGEVRVLEMDAGSPLSAIWNLLLNVARSNRGAKRPPG